MLILERDMTSIPKSSICWQYRWAIPPTGNTLFLSGFIGIPGLLDKAFRLGAKTDGLEFIKVCCYVNCIELERLGHKVSAVTCYCKSKRGGNLLTELEIVGTEASAVVFSRDVACCVEDELISFNFSLYDKGSVEQFVPVRFDALVCVRLWAAAVNRKMTDVLLQVGGKLLFAHKFILAARSPVFKAMFASDTLAEARTGHVQIDDMLEPETFQQFLYFLYTGQLVQPACPELGRLADRYQVAALVAICRSAVTSEAALHSNLLSLASCSRMTYLPFQEKELSGLFAETICKAKLTIVTSSFHRMPTEEDSQQLNVEGNAVAEVYTVRGVIPRTNGSEWILQDVFRYKFDQIPSAGPSANRIVFYSCSLMGVAWTTTGVDIVVTKVINEQKGREICLHRSAMVPKLMGMGDRQPLQVFAAEMGSCGKEPCILRFIVHRKSTIPDFRYELKDEKYAFELWSTSIKKEWTDVELQVEDRTFSAHRALLAARCPSLATLIEESGIGGQPIRVPNISAATFKDLLCFLYTGMLRTFPPSEGLLEAAKTYQVETLRLIGETGRHEFDQDQLSEALISLI